MWRKRRNSLDYINARVFPVTVGGAPVLDVIHNRDALSLLRALPDGCVDLIVTDPPYFKVKPVWWDWQWNDRDAFIGWIGELALEWRRVLKSNGSLYVFASPQMAARVEVKIGELFNILNSISWWKTTGNRNWAADKKATRSFLPNTERIIFAEQRVADSEYQDALIDENSTYWSACEATKRSIMGDYLSAEFERAKVSRRDIAALFPSKTGNLTGCVSNWLLGYNLPTHEQYQAMREYLNTQHRNGSADYLRREYEDLRREYEDLRREYEDLRRPFNITERDQFTDVWNFAPIRSYHGKHPTEKPIALMQHLINASSRPGDIALDCFAGSGTTLDAARLLGRHYIGCDLDPQWVEYARARLALPFTPDMFDTLPAREPAPQRLTLDTAAAGATTHAPARG